MGYRLGARLRFHPRDLLARKGIFHLILVIEPERDCFHDDVP
jgi:hypothetical protein